MSIPLILPDAWMFLALYGTTIAFVVALYTLLGQDSALKEGRASLIPAILTLAISVLLSFIPLMFTGFFTLGKPITLVRASNWGNILLFISGFPFIFAVILVLFSMLRVHGRVTHLREDKYFKYSPPVKWVRGWFKTEDSYEVQKPEPRKPASLGLLKELNCDDKQFETGCSVLLLYDSKESPWNIAIDFVDCGLTNGESVHYVTCQQPSWFVWDKAYTADPTIDAFHNYLVFIDCYISVFGFDDEVLKKSRENLERRGISVVTAGGIAGLHTATAKAFNITKKTIRAQTPHAGTARSIRKPHRMIYDSVSALADASGIEQVRLFFRHVIPSERSYGMFTLIIESEKSDEVLLNSIRSIVDVVCEVHDGKLKLIRK